MYQNMMYGEAHGFEIAANGKMTDRWSLSPGFAFANEHVHTGPKSADLQTPVFEEGSSPDHMIQLRSHFDLRRSLACDAFAYCVDALRNQGPLNNLRIPSYTKLGTGLTWKLGEALSASVVGQNLLKDHHLEFVDVNGSMPSGQVKRRAYAKLTWQF